MINLLVKALAGFIFLFLVLGIMIFAPAGTIHYFQGWVYLFAFGVPVLLITFYLAKNDPGLLERRVKAGAVAEKEKTQKGIQTVANVFFCLVYIVAGFDIRYHWSSIPQNISYIADIFVVLGLFIVFLVFKENSYTSAIIEVGNDQKVISTGPYSLMRHPMYSGAILMMLATPIALGSYWALFGVIPLIWVIILRLLEEEKFLLKNLPGYEDYCRKVIFHIIPFVW
jgi:protein-S-isoprenylcysteine O-methyltransferase Ste14